MEFYGRVQLHKKCDWSDWDASASVSLTISDFKNENDVEEKFHKFYFLLCFVLHQLHIQRKWLFNTSDLCCLLVANWLLILESAKVLGHFPWYFLSPLAT